MSKKQDAFYFEKFAECAACSSQSAQLLHTILRNFDAARVQDYLNEMHAIEHAADLKKHDITEALVKAFITPIDREDIVQVSHNLDDLTDRLEDVLIRVYCSNITVIRPDAIEMVGLVCECADAVSELMGEFHAFKRSKKIKDILIRINSLEEQADRLFIACMHRLHSERDNLIEIITWRDIYACIEKCADTAEHIADIVEGVIMKNS